jgi:ornithine carbamoyltransferase
LNDFLNINEVSLSVLETILEDAHKLKKGLKPGFKGKVGRSNSLKGCTLGLLFEKPSTRTRLSFEAGIIHLGGNLINLPKNEIHLNQGESIEDTANVLSLFLDIVVLRLFKEEHLYEFARNSKIPVINGLTDESHPCQVLTDIFTFQELRGSIKEKTVVWFGVSNNVLKSFLHAAVIFDFKLIFCGPEKFQPAETFFDSMSSIEKNRIVIENDPIKAVKLADLVVTDKWASMHDDALKKSELEDLMAYQININLLDKGKEDVIFMHCLPATKGLEVSQEILKDKRSFVLREAENRMHLQKSIMRWCLKAI